ncbi:signal recognition particle, SRP9/SRP14 subunit [Hesseltinella vesiculosa]|uniref:Signal recognition particle, SRP9/SRP14 subunit n=1 Tax=Hesseltinella vesiculosa TaxID=101127 RepID=A0A1X2G8Y8_9FUNG|nr:signal recognition particle, SRP9/SRP14 subunit [Hesseltinella vesiculosa]
MYINNWDDFQKAAEDIYTSSPDTTRYVHSFHGADGQLVLKVTNDQTVVMYKTDQASDLKKFIGLNTLLMSQMQNRSLEPEAVNTPPAQPSPQIPQVASAKSTNKKKKKRGGK